MKRGLVAFAILSLVLRAPAGFADEAAAPGKPDLDSPESMGERQSLSDRKSVV